MQPIGWEPDLSDGVRMNIRPFVQAEVLRVPSRQLGIKWEPDRGKDVPSAPRVELGPAYGEPEGTRINDHHLSLAEKQASRSRVAAGKLPAAIQREAHSMKFEWDKAKAATNLGKHGVLFDGTTVALLDPAIAKVFPTSEAVNEALLGLLTLAQQAARIAAPEERPARKRPSTLHRR